MGITLDYSDVRKALQDKITESFVEGSDTIIGVTGWIVIAEVNGGHDNRNLFVVSGDILGTTDIPYWTAKGWLDEVSENIYLYIGPDDLEEEEE